MTSKNKKLDPKFLDHSLVVVEWVDSFRGTQWEILDDSPIIPPVHYSVGWIEKKTGTT